MTQIAGFPTGLLDLLGSQNFGENPRDLGNVIAPVVDVRELFQVTKQRVIFNSGTDVLANGNNSLKTFALTVPAGEVWRIVAGSAFLNTAVGETVGQAYLSATIGGGTTIISDGVPLAASQTRWANLSAEPFFAPAGTLLSIWGSEVVGVPTAALTILAARLRA